MARIRVVQIDNLRGFLSIRRKDGINYTSKSSVEWVKVFSNGLDILKEWGGNRIAKRDIGEGVNVKYF